MPTGRDSVVLIERNLHERFGQWDTVYHRFNEWRKKGATAD
jgi:hypothetical protein